MGISIRIFWWVLQRLGLALLLAGLALFALGWWASQRDGNDFAAHRREVVRGLILDGARLRDNAEAAAARMAATRVAITAQRERAVQAGKVARQIEDLGGGLNRFTASSAQQAEDRERLARMRQMEKDSFQRAGDLEQTLVRIQWEKDGIEIALARNQEELAAARSDRSRFWHYARLTWNSYGRWALGAAGAVVVLPLLFRRRRVRTEVAERG